MFKIELESIICEDFGTKLIANVYRNNENINSQFPKSAFLWTKKDRQGNIDDVWNYNHKNVGSIVYITMNDILEKSTFQCTLNV